MTNKEIINDLMAKNDGVAVIIEVYAFLQGYIEATEDCRRRAYEKRNEDKFWKKEMIIQDAQLDTALTLAQTIKNKAKKLNIDIEELFEEKDNDNQEVWR